MEEVLFESKVKCDGYKGRHYVFLNSKGFSIKKKKYTFFGEYIDVEDFQIREIKEKSGRTLARIVDKKVDIIFNNKSINMNFYNYEDASIFYDKIIELKKNDTFVNRSINKMQNITEEDIKKTIKKVVKTVGIVGIIVHGVKSVVKDGKGIFEEGKEVIKSIFKK